MDYKIIDLQKHSDARGDLVSVEKSKEIPFEIKRIYYMYNTGDNVRRGYHAHKSLQQILICVHGSCRIRLDDAFSTEEVLLDDPSKGLYLSSGIWREMYDFSEDAVLLVMASELYDEDDYIRDYQNFCDSIRK